MTGPPPKHDERAGILLPTRSNMNLHLPDQRKTTRTLHEAADRSKGVRVR